MAAFGASFFISPAVVRLDPEAGCGRQINGVADLAGGQPGDRLFGKSGSDRFF